MIDERETFAKPAKDLFNVTYFGNTSKYKKIKQVPVENSTWNGLMKNFDKFATFDLKIVAKERLLNKLYDASIIVTKCKQKIPNASCLYLKDNWFLYFPNDQNIKEVINLETEKFKKIFRKHNYEDRTEVIIKTKHKWPKLKFDRGKIEAKEFFKEKMGLTGFLRPLSSKTNFPIKNS